MHHKSELYDLFFRFAERDHFLALIMLTIIGLGPLILAAFKQDPRDSWVQSFWFCTALVWFAMVCADVTGFATWFNQGLQFPEFASQ